MIQRKEKNSGSVCDSDKILVKYMKPYALRVLQNKSPRIELMMCSCVAITPYCRNVATKLLSSLEHCLIRQAVQRSHKVEKGQGTFLRSNNSILFPSQKRLQPRVRQYLCTLHLASSTLYTSVVGDSDQGIDMHPPRWEADTEDRRKRQNIVAPVKMPCRELDQTAPKSQDRKEKKWLLELPWWEK